MAELQTLARPYAKAVFELAKETGSYQSWSEQLAAIALAVAQPAVAQLIGHPAVGKAELANAIAAALGSVITQQGRALLQLLVDNERLVAAAELSAEYELLRAQAESRIGVEITTAAPVAPEQQSLLSAAIGKRLNRAVDVQWSTDESLVAGAVIRAGDLVIDGSFSGELDRLRASLVV
jgi:F-type H+-transporting ATPase subunit delta